MTIKQVNNLLIAGMICPIPNFFPQYTHFGTYTLANKKKTTPIHWFVENKYRHVMIINLYIVSHAMSCILYDRHLYECILWGFCACLKEAWGCTQPFVEYISIVQPASDQIR